MEQIVDILTEDRSKGYFIIQKSDALAYGVETALLLSMLRSMYGHFDKDENGMVCTTLNWLAASSGIDSTKVEMFLLLLEKHTNLVCTIENGWKVKYKLVSVQEKNAMIGIDPSIYN